METKDRGEICRDLLLQAMTGLSYTTGNGDNGPVPFGIAVGDILCGAQLVQGIIAAGRSSMTTIRLQNNLPVVFLFHPFLQTLHL